jgi:hypothetical protein
MIGALLSCRSLIIAVPPPHHKSTDAGRYTSGPQRLILPRMQVQASCAGFWRAVPKKKDL